MARTRRLQREFFFFLSRTAESGDFQMRKFQLVTVSLTPLLS